MKRVLLIVGLLFLLAPARAEAASEHVAMENYAYSSASLTIQVGDTVTWTNHDQAPHDVVTTSAPAAFRSPLLETGQTWSFTFTVPGTYSYYCSVHPDMRAEIVVMAPEPAPAPETVAPAPETTTTVAPPAEETAAAPLPAPTTTTAVPAQQTAQPAQAAMTASLDPMLLVAGLVAGVTILCLLLMNARPEP
ncbi:cupredoxin family copper-binding protein [Actinophytocola sp.]|uniref:cupredoxin domain-containing protein n=1 Tax=Actinophytocola sp. TaxID=1872138 RepID=UPI002ED44508